MNARELNEQLEPTEVLRFIGYHKSSPTASGKEIRDYCPIHKGNKQKSLSISQENHLYICHSCNATGDLIDLYAKSSGLEFRDAVEQLASQFHPHHLSFTREPSSAPKLPHKTSSEHSKISVNDRWNKCSETGKHPYLSKKKISSPPGVRFGQDDHGNHSLVIPFYNAERRLQTLQFINEHGKFFLKDISYLSSFFLLGDIKEGEQLYIAEGVATAMTIWEALEKKIVVASVGSAGNIAVAVAAIRKNFPSLRIKLALDNSKAAMDALHKVEPPFTYSIPDFSSANIPEGIKVDDFNDLISVCGFSTEDVKYQLEKSLDWNEKIKKE